MLEHRVNLCFAMRFDVMAKPRTQKLKVFRTPIGFHDAYVAAPSQKAALEAWGAESNLFAQGIAEQVTEPELMAEPLQRPGEVIRRLRGSAKEQLAAVGTAAAARGRRRPSPRPSPASGRGRGRVAKPPKPSRAEVDRAEAALDEAETRQRREQRDMEREIEGLERRRRELLRRHEAERDELQASRDRARASYERAIRAWERE